MPAVDEYFEENGRLVKPGCTVGRTVNVSITLNFLCILIASILVVATLAHLQQEIHDHPDNSTHSHHCILYSHNVDQTIFHYGTTYTCEFVMYGFGIIAVVALVFSVVSVIRAILASDLWFTVIVEMVVLIVCIVVVFVMGLVVSIGLAATCKEVKQHYGSPNDNCNKKIPNGEGVYYLHELNSTQAASWFTFMFLAVALLVFIIRVVIFLRRRRRRDLDVNSGDAAGEREQLLASQGSHTKPV